MGDAVILPDGTIFVSNGGAVGESSACLKPVHPSSEEMPLYAVVHAMYACH